MSNYDVVMGIEIHCELKTNSKCFSGAPNTFGKPPNSQTSAIDCGYPGVLPAINLAVVIAAIKTCSALKMTIDPLLRFDRKNYFYPDLPKGYQITQFYHPIGRNGAIDVIVDNQIFTVSFERLHIEEDTAKQIHESQQTCLDYNRAGIPLLEIVTKPVFNNSKQVVAYVNAIRQILLYLKVSDAKMNEGSFRCDLNISLKPLGAPTLGNKVEIKNLNSIHNLALAINDEIDRQTKILNNNETVASQTRRFDEQTNKTVLMRHKTTAIDYKYFPEPNIFPIQLETTWINNIIKNLPELPEAITARLVKHYHLSVAEINLLIDHHDLLKLFEATVKINNLIMPTFNYLLGPVQGYCNANNIRIANSKCSANALAQLVTLIEQQKINDRQSKQILAIIMTKADKSPNELIKTLQMTLISDESELETYLIAILNAHGEMMAQYQTYPERVIKFFMGQLMKNTKGQANPQVAQVVLKKLIANYDQEK